MNIRQRLIMLRKEHRMSQQDVANMLHIGRSTYAGYELGIREMNYEMLKSLSSIYKVSVDYILGKTECKSEQHELKNAKEFLAKSDLHWDGVPLSEQELRPIRELLEIVVSQRLKRDTESS